MVYKEEKHGAFTLHTIKTDKFKLCHMEIIFRNNVVKEDITKRNILFDLLTESNKDFETKRSLTLRLEDLYNASLYSVTSKVGNAILTNVCLDFINPKYTEKKVLEETLKLPFDMIFNPLATNKEFNNKLLEIIKKRAEADIKSVQENPKKYAILEAIKTLGENTPSSYSNIGSLFDLENVTPESLYKYYEKVLKNDFIDIYIIGDLDMEKVSEIINKYANFDIIKNHEFSFYVENAKRKPVIKKENFIYSQTNITMILSLTKLSEYEKKYVANIYNLILGGGSLETKLFRRLRGENSLCYNVNSMYQKYDGLILISTAVDINSEEKAIKLIKQAINDMTNKITEEELKKSKELIISALTMNMDNIGKIVDNYFYRNTSDLDDYETRIETFKNVSIEELYNLSKKISISTIHSLIGGDEE
ncbi:MAG: insulinase family protein [Bacilli bacterium]|nr:insulinase family protein [Bacilli bacterium]